MTGIGVKQLDCRAIGQILVFTHSVNCCQAGLFSDMFIFRRGVIVNRQSQAKDLLESRQ